MLNRLGRLLAQCRIVRTLVPIAGLAMLLLLAGCADQVETSLVVQPDGTWTGEMRLSFSRTPAGIGGQEELGAMIEEQAAALLDRQGIDHTLLSPAAEDSTQDYTLALSGQDVQALGQLLSNSHTAALVLSGPVVVEITGNVQAGEALQIALPANLSTGFAWAVEPAAGDALLPVGEMEFRQVEPGVGTLSRQVIRLQAGQGGLATLRLVYRRSWEPDAAPSSVYRVDAAETEMAAILAAVSMPEPLPARQAPPPIVPAAVEPDGATPELPTYYSWCDLGGCTPIKDQNPCGGCWAFATVGVLESAIKIQDSITTDLSEQYLVSCNTEGWSCSGGWWAHDYHQWKYSWPETMAGAVPESEFPFEAWNVPCGGPYSHPYRITSWAILSPEWGVASVADIKQAIYDHGPVAVAMCAGSAFQAYRGGVFSTNEASACAPNSVNHAVVLVGWNDSDSTWILRNSWDTWWGESGYMRIKWNISNVGYRTSYINYTSAGPTPDAPSGLTSTAMSQHRINLTWTDNSTNESGFKIERSPLSPGSWTQISTVGSNVKTYADTTGLASNTTYYYRVRAWNASGDSGYSNQAHATTFSTSQHLAYLPLVVKNSGQSGSCALPIDEGFEGGAAPPVGWSRIQTNPRDTWKIQAMTGVPYSGSYAADVEYDDQLALQDEVLLSPQFTASSAQLQFYSFGSLYWCRDTYDNCDLNIWLVVGNWGGGDDIYVGEADGSWTATWAWSPMTINLTPYLPGGTPVRVAFQYYGQDGAQVGLDQINITGSCSGGGFDSEFNNSADGWVSHSGTWYIGSSYLNTYGLAGTSSSASYTADFGNFDYQASMWRSGCNTCANRILFRGTPNPLTADNGWYNEYKLQYNRDGNYSVYKRTAGGSAIAIVPWTYSAVINQGSAWNTLRVVANGTSLTFYINGTLLWSGSDSSLSYGRAGLGMYQDSSAGNELRVDWARLSLLTSAPPAVALPAGEPTVVDGNEDQVFP